jgi:hypothetical protein
MAIKRNGKKGDHYSVIHQHITSLLNYPKSMGNCIGINVRKTRMKRAYPNIHINVKGIVIIYLGELD